jgi:thymidine phosphorylase
MDALEIIAVKRDGGRLSDAQIRWFISAFTAEEVSDEQAAALLMAILFRGMETHELATWTDEMIASGTRLDLSSVGRPTVDKHSTGGVGDKVSLILVPLVAACGAAVPQLSGRGLGHTGGTLDKMEAIAGWRAQLSAQEFVDQLRDVGGVIAAAGDDLAPADRRMYSLRDVTGTVQSIPLIASSIMSKKIAEGTDALVLNVTVGSGAFLPELEKGRLLAETMVGIGEANGVRTVAVLTSMDTVLGRTAGNALEVAESLEILAGGGPADAVEVTLALAREMVDLAGLDADPAAVLAGGKPMDVFREMVEAQGGDLDVPLPVAPHVHIVEAPASGYLSRLDCLAVGIAAWRLGAGRARKEDSVDPAAGVVCLAKPGDPVTAGDPLLELHTSDLGRVGGALDALTGGIDVSDTPPALGPLVIERVPG